jgi:hypothetical protein
MDLNNLVIEGGEIRLCELEDTHLDRIEEIAWACAETSTRNLYYRWKKDQEVRQIMSIEESLRILLDDFNRLERELVADGLNTSSLNYKRHLDERLHMLSATVHFSTFGPFKAPYRDSAEKYIKESRDFRTDRSRKRFRLGIEIMEDNEWKLVGCVAMHGVKFPDIGGPAGYPAETTGQPGIFIDPAYRQTKFKGGPPIIRRAITLGMAVIDLVYPPEIRNSPLCLTAHPLNEESLAIIRKLKGITEYGNFKHPRFGLRVYFTMSYEDFIKCFSSVVIEDMKIKVCNIQFDTTRTRTGD